jgi:hypothetical protein
MSRTFVGCIVISLIFFTVISVEAQDTTAPDTTNPSEQVPKVKRPKQVPNPPDKPPDMVCFGDGPKFSIQFVSWGARYLGINQPDKDFRGGLFWVPDQKVWLWQQENNLASVGGGDVLLARVQNASCTDPGRKGTFPFAVVVTLPQGDMLSGCCRILKAGEAPAAPKSVPSNATPAQ